MRYVSMTMDEWRSHVRPGAPRLVDTGRLGRTGYPPRFWTRGDLATKTRIKRDSKRLLEHGFASSLTPEEVAYISWWLTRSPKLRRLWGVSGRDVRLSPSVIAKVAARGKPDDPLYNAALARTRNGHPVVVERRARIAEPNMEFALDAA
ncbi:MAG: hypothetical protein FJ318_06605 [SAR202 cluster bacterium]|nr:hypothetical protein [SAR202 cluster bacterium]